MAVTAGALSLVSKSASQVKAVSAAASGGTGPYTYQWYRSTTSGFTPGGGNILSGKTSLDLTDDTVIGGTTYYYKVVATDTGDSNVTDESAQLAVSTDINAQNPNQFAQRSVLGMLDLRFNPNTVAVQIDSSEAGVLYAGQAVKMVDSAGGVPKVVACTADSDQVLGFLNYNIKNVGYSAGDAAEISMNGNCQFLRATAAIARGARVVVNVLTIGGVTAVSGSGGERIVGWAYDKASNPGDLIRVMIETPSFAVDA